MRTPAADLADKLIQRLRLDGAGYRSEVHDFMNLAYERGFEEGKREEHERMNRWIRGP